MRESDGARRANEAGEVRSDSAAGTARSTSAGAGGTQSDTILVYTHQVKPGREADYERWVRDVWMPALQKAGEEVPDRCKLPRSGNGCSPTRTSGGIVQADMCGSLNRCRPFPRELRSGVFPTVSWWLVGFLPRRRLNTPRPFEKWLRQWRVGRLFGNSKTMAISD